MPDIKLKEKSIIKQLDKKVVHTQNFKNNLVTTKERLNEFTSKEENTSAENYASNHIQNDISYLSRKGATKSNEIGKKSLENTKQNIIKSKEKISNIKSKIKQKKAQQIKNAVKKRAEFLATVFPCVQGKLESGHPAYHCVSAGLLGTDESCDWPLESGGSWHDVLDAVLGTCICSRGAAGNSQRAVSYAVPI